MLGFDRELLINQWVQGVKPDAEVLRIYDDTPVVNRHDILRELVDYCRQARPVPDDGERAVAASAIKPGRSACVILSKGVTNETLHRLAQLKGIDGLDAFMLLLHVLRIADLRRRRDEPQPCHHWWHRDLGDERVVASLRERYQKGVF